jgi:uncharacterized protein Usg
MTALERQLQGWRLTTAEILYHLPDHPAVLQSYIWQNLDLAPKYPELARFLAFWESSLDGRLHSVRLAQSAIVAPARVNAGTEFRLH